MNKRDKPLSFHWRAADESWIDVLGLPKARSSKHCAARQAIIVDAALTGIATPGQYISYSRRRGWWGDGKRYRGSAFTGVTVPNAVDELANEGLLESQVAPSGSRGWQSRFRASPMLIEAARPRLLSPNTGASTVIYEPREVIRLKNLDRRLIDYRDTRRTDALRRQMAEINEALRATDIDLISEGVSREGPFLRLGGVILNQTIDVMHRIFSRGSFALHGRLYGPWWQRVPKNFRQHLTINGSSTAELDYGSQHLRILYAQEGVRIETGSDPYLIEDWPRPLVKRAVMALINALSEREAIAVICDHRNGLAALTGSGAHARAMTLIEAIKRRHAPVAHQFHRDQGIRLMRIDSELAISILKAMHRRGAAVLPIHDSFICKRRHAGDLKEEMGSAWRHRFGQEIPFISMACAESGLHIPPLSLRPNLAIVSPVDDSSDLFGGRQVPDCLRSWTGGLAPKEVRHFLRDELRDRQIRGVALARSLGISRPHLVNVLRGRFGTTTRVAEALKMWALHDR
jgi:hypothetical protein